MKVYVVTAFCAEPYDHTTWVHGVYDSLEKAQEAVGPRYTVYGEEVDEETGNRWGGYMLSSHIEVRELQ